MENIEPISKKSKCPWRRWPPARHSSSDLNKLRGVAAGGTPRQVLGYFGELLASSKCSHTACMLRFLAASCLARNPDLNFEISSNHLIKNGVGIAKIGIGIGNGIQIEIAIERK